MKIHALAALLLIVPAAATLAQPPHSHRGHGGLERADADNDGRISRAEFDKARAEREARIAQNPERAAKRGKHAPVDFAAIDTNRDGYIVRTELQAYHERMRPQREAERQARFDQRFKDADINKDGKLSRVEVDEKMGRMSDRFAWMDDNKDGFLSRAELSAGRARR
jgi:Ca2+-binding EF-hand superfamily protein